MPERESPKRPPNGPPPAGLLAHTWSAWLVLALGLALTAAAAWAVARTTRAWDALRFERHAEFGASLVARRLEAYIALLRATAAFVGTEGEMIDAREFAAFHRALDLQREYPGIQGIGWSARLPPGREPPPDTAAAGVWPETAAAERHAIVYIEPLDRRNQAALGYDMSTEPTRRAAMQRARDTGEPAATGPVTLVQEIDERKQAGFLIYAPVYAGSGDPETVPARRERLRGFAYAAFRADDLLRGIYGPGGPPPTFGLQVYDLDGDGGRALLHTSDGDRGGARARFRATRPLDVAGRPWLLQFTSRPAFERGAVPLVPGVVVAGVGLSLALFALMLTQGRARAIAERAAADLAASEAALRRSEERFRALVDQSPLSTQLFAPDGRSLRANPAWERMWGLSHADLGEYNVLHDPSLEEKGILELIREVFAGQARALPMIPYTLPRGEYAGQPRWVRAFAYPVLEPSGRLREVVLIHEDITERVRAEEALQRAQRMESIGVLAGGVAHDFNNLLTGILGYAELALHALPPAAPAAQHLRQVLSAGNRAAELTRQLLAYAGKGRYVVARIDLSDTVREMRDLVHASISRAITVDLDLDPPPLPVMADGSQIQQLVMNLVINAAEAIGDRFGRIRIAARRRALGRADLRARYPDQELSPGEYIELVVEDDGVGMDAAVRARIFEPFFTTKFMGRGLGLAAAVGIVRSHAGGITVDSAPGVGTTFRIVLPLAAGPVIEAPVPETPALRGSESVLVVDDELVIREAARRVLEGAGYQVTIAPGGAEALARLRAEPGRFDLVVLDLTMPDLGGPEVLAELRAAAIERPVLLTSGYGEAEAVARIPPGSIAGFLQKPWTTGRLLAAVRAALDARRGPGA